MSALGADLQFLDQKSGLALRTWKETHLEATIQSQRDQAFPSHPRGTKAGTNQLAIVDTN